MLLFVLAGLAGAMRLFKKGSPPTPDLAIEEAKLMRAELEAQAIAARSGGTRRSRRVEEVKR